MVSKYKRITILDVARLAKVSTTSVSRVINNQGVGKETKKRVLRIIQRYEYYPNPYAQYLGRRNNGSASRKM